MTRERFRTISWCGMAFMLCLSTGLAQGRNLNPTWTKLPTPDVTLRNQNGDKVKFAEVVRNRRFIINFVFTTCTTICGLQGANFSELQHLLERSGGDYQLISISIDPAVDTPQRLKAWGVQFNAGPNWTLLSGAKPDVEGLLKTLKVFSADKLTHTPVYLVGSGSSGLVTRIADGLQTPLSDLVELMAAADRQETSAAQRYFTDTILVDQHGEKRRFYSDLLKDRVVLIQFFFTSCQGSCPMLVERFVKLQRLLGDRLGKDIFFYSITVDPEVDTPAKLKGYAEAVKARPGWLFLSGDKKDVELIIAKLGHVGPKENHLNLFLAGNLCSGAWKKIMGLSPADSILTVLESVMKGRG